MRLWHIMCRRIPKKSQKKELEDNTSENIKRYKEKLKKIKELKELKNLLKE